MADGSEEASAPSALGSGAVGDREFRQALRGYDRKEVRRYLTEIAADLERLRAHDEVRAAQLASAEERAADPVLSEEAIVAAVGEEMAVALRSAHSAAHDLTARAGEECRRLIEEAYGRAAAIGAEVDRRLTDADAQAEVRLEQARVEADAIVSVARAAATAAATQIRAEADAAAQQQHRRAEEEGRASIEEAQATRDMVLVDLARRRRLATTQIEQLRAGRERLVQSYAVVRRTLDEVHDEMQRADNEARAAAAEVGRRLGAQPDPARREPGEVGPAAAGAAPIEGRTSADPGEGGRSVVADAAVPGEGRSDRAGADPGTGSSGDAVDDVQEPEIELDGLDLDGLELEAPGGSAPAARPAGAGTARPLDRRRTVEATAPPALAVRSDLDESELQRRDGQLAQLEVDLTRRLKRVLQDEHNDLLDRLRRVSGIPTLGALLATPEQHAERYRVVARPFVQRAAAAGAAFAAPLDGAPARDLAGIETAVAGPTTVAIVAAIVVPLRRRVEAVLAERGDEGGDALVDALVSVYREGRSPARLQPLVADALSAAHSEGTWRAATGKTTLRWVTEDAGGPCPDCDDNVLAGPVRKGEAFPTGQMYPPAHRGCRCLLVPVSS